MRRRRGARAQWRRLPFRAPTRVTMRVVVVALPRPARETIVSVAKRTLPARSRRLPAAVVCSFTRRRLCGGIRKRPVAITIVLGFETAAAEPKPALTEIVVPPEQAVPAAHVSTVEVPP